MSELNFEEIINLLKVEVVPALGCTEPIAVALAAAKAKETLNNEPEYIEVWVSGNILKNGMGVGIPGTSMIGLDVAAALGAICGKSSAELEVLKEITEQDIINAKKVIEAKKVTVEVKNVPEKLYVEVICKSGDDYSKVVIKDRHTNIEKIELNNKILFEKKKESIEIASSEVKETKLSIEKIYKFATSVKLEEIKFILEAVKMNKAIAKEGMKGNYGLQVGKKITEKVKSGLLSDDIMSCAMSYAAAAADARMAGCMYPVMSNSGSGNQGITVMLPIIAVAEKLQVDDEKLTRALIIGNLVAIHIKKYLGQLSALCGCVVAAIGASSGITYLFDGKLDGIVFAIKNMIGNISGMICDGAKAGCALKVSTSVSAAVQSALLAIDGIEISENDGIIEDDIEKTIRNLAEIGSRGMNETDKLILDIMVCK